MNFDNCLGSQNAVFLSWIGLDGFMLASMTCGMSPVTSMMEGVQQVSLKPWS